MMPTNYTDDDDNDDDAVVVDDDVSVDGRAFCVYNAERSHYIIRTPGHCRSCSAGAAALAFLRSHSLRTLL